MISGSLVSIFWRRFVGLTVVVALGGLGNAQQKCQALREMKAEPENLKFAASTPGTAPSVWLLGPEWFMPPHEPVYKALIVSAASCNGSQQCAAVRSVRVDPTIPLAFLYQVVDAARYRGKWLTFRAAVRTDVAAASVARLLVRVHRNDCTTSFRDDMGDHPITAGTWSTYEIHAPISLDAGDIEFGMQLIGPGEAWIDNISWRIADAN
jgi:hypothetical protein